MAHIGSNRVTVSEQLDSLSATSVYARFSKARDTLKSTFPISFGTIRDASGAYVLKLVTMLVKKLRR